MSNFYFNCGAVVCLARKFMTFDRMTFSTASDNNISAFQPNTQKKIYQ